MSRHAQLNPQLDAGPVGCASHRKRSHRPPGCQFLDHRSSSNPTLVPGTPLQPSGRGGGTTGLEPATSAVTENQRQVTYLNQGERMAPFSALRKRLATIIAPLSHPRPLPCKPLSKGREQKGA